MPEPITRPAPVLVMEDDVPTRHLSLVYPNPARDHIKINTPELEGEYRVTIFDRQGQPLQDNRSHAREGNITMSLNNLAPGLYYVRIVSATGVTLNEKFLVER
ncbi:MAG TPA: T9SS type A sorting domain-containing protein [Cyclobacteriaceae bacterium]